jgi:hypothetical protein
MLRQNYGYKGKGAVELLEEATCLVRRASSRDLCCYYLGTLPFVFCFLAFCVHMGGSPGTASRLIPESLVLAFLFVWMKCWQAVYARGLRAELQNVRPSAFSPARLALVQGILQPWGFIVLPVALLLTIPSGWCYAFFQNVTVLGCDGDAGTVYGKARRQAVLFNGQNLLVMLLFLVLSLALFVNLLAAAFFLPFLMKTLFGVETAFTRSFHFILNTTFLASLSAVTYLLLDPFVKAAYVLRCFHGESLESGADLLTELRSLRRTAGKSAALLLAGVSLLAALTVFPADASTGAVRAAPAPAADARDLDRAIGDVLKRPEFAWPSSRKAQTGEQRHIPGFLTSLADTLKEWMKGVERWIGKIIEWLAERLMGDGARQKNAGRWEESRGWMVSTIMFSLTAALLSVCGVMLWRRLRKGKRSAGASPAPVVAAEPDIRDDAVTAEELSLDRWRRLADELLAAGETRLALRALYFACIVRLADAGLLIMDRAKSDRDYERELRRRAHSITSLIDAFSGNVAMFQSTWYGMHATSGEMVELFQENYRRIAAYER